MSECVSLYVQIYVSLYVRIILCHTGGEELKARRAAKLRVFLIVDSGEELDYDQKVVKIRCCSFSF